MRETIRGVLYSAAVCCAISLFAQLLRAHGTLSFLPENEMEQAAAALGTSIAQEWSNDALAVFAKQR